MRQRQCRFQFLDYFIIMYCTSLSTLRNHARMGAEAIHGKYQFLKKSQVLSPVSIFHRTAELSLFHLVTLYSQASGTGTREYNTQARQFYHFIGHQCLASDCAIFHHFFFADRRIKWKSF